MCLQLHARNLSSVPKMFLLSGKFILFGLSLALLPSKIHESIYSRLFPLEKFHFCTWSTFLSLHIQALAHHTWPFAIHKPLCSCWCRPKISKGFSMKLFWFSLSQSKYPQFILGLIEDTGYLPSFQCRFLMVMTSWLLWIFREGFGVVAFCLSLLLDSCIQLSWNLSFLLCGSSLPFSTKECSFPQQEGQSSGVHRLWPSWFHQLRPNHHFSRQLQGYLP